LRFAGSHEPTIVVITTIVKRKVRSRSRAGARGTDERRGANGKPKRDSSLRLE
jgi:hypothetical protein